MLLGISSCLTGNKVRYDGGHQYDRFSVEILGKHVEYIPVCPEAGCGLSIPREAMRLVATADGVRLLTRKTQIDITPQMLEWTDKQLEFLAQKPLCGFIFKSKSPSSGMTRVKIYSEQGLPVSSGSGIFADAFMKRFPYLPVEEEGRLTDDGLRHSFLVRIFTMNRWHEFMSSGPSKSKLQAFHASHKYLIMSFSPLQLRALGKIPAKQGDLSDDDYSNYLQMLMGGLSMRSTTKKNVNVLEHMLGYFKKELSADEKKEMLEVIRDYSEGKVPHSAPLTLMKHYVRKYREPYLENQWFLNPYPPELLLR